MNTSRLGSLGLGAPVQVAYAVPDPHGAARRWAERFGAGPFVVREHIPLERVMYRGAPAVFDHTSAYGQWGALMVELVCDHGSGPSIVRERFGTSQSGLHHVAHLVDDLDRTLDALSALGFDAAMTATTGTTRFAFVDTIDELGHFLELYARSDRLAAFYAAVAGAATGWDGSDPVRTSL